MKYWKGECTVHRYPPLPPPRGRVGEFRLGFGIPPPFPHPGEWICSEFPHISPTLGQFRWKYWLETKQIVTLIFKDSCIFKRNKTNYPLDFQLVMHFSDFFTLLLNNTVISVLAAASEFPHLSPTPWEALRNSPTPGDMRRPEFPHISPTLHGVGGVGDTYERCIKDFCFLCFYLSPFSLQMDLKYS